MGDTKVLRSHTEEGRQRKTDKLHWSSVPEKNSQAQLEDGGTEKEFPQRWWKRKGMVFYQFSKGLGFFFEHWQTCFLSWFFGFYPIFMVQGKLLHAVLLRQREHVKNTGFLELPDYFFIIYFSMGKILRIFLFLFFLSSFTFLLFPLFLRQLAKNQTALFPILENVSSCGKAFELRQGHQPL